MGFKTIVCVKMATLSPFISGINRHRSSGMTRDYLLFVPLSSAFLIVLRSRIIV